MCLKTRVLYLHVLVLLCVCVNFKVALFIRRQIRKRPAWNAFVHSPPCVLCVTWHKSNVAETLLRLVRISNFADSRLETSPRRAATSVSSPSFSFLWTRSNRPSALFTCECPSRVPTSEDSSLPCQQVNGCGCGVVFFAREATGLRRWGWASRLGPRWSRWVGSGPRTTACSRTGPHSGTTVQCWASLPAGAAEETDHFFFF